MFIFPSCWPCMSVFPALVMHQLIIYHVAFLATEMVCPFSMYMYMYMYVWGVEGSKDADVVLF